MADTSVPITVGAGTNVDVRTEATNGDARQVVVIGDPSVNAGVAPVDSVKGLAVDLSQAGSFPALPTGANSIGKISEITTAVVPGTSATNLGKAEDAGHTTGDTGVMLLGVRNDTPTSLSGADLDYTPVATDQYGFIRQSNLNVVITITRPADVNVYASGDSVANSTSAPTAFTASLFSRNNAGAGRIERIVLTCSVAAATKANLELWIFGSSYTNTNDNVAVDYSDTDNDKVIAVVPLGGSPIVGGANCTYQAEVDIPFVCGAASTSLWCGLVVRNAYTPTSAEIFKIRFLGTQFN